MDAYDGLTREQLLVLVREQGAVLAALRASLTEQQVLVQRLEARVKELERRLEKGGPRGMPGLKPAPPQEPPSAPKPRTRRAHGFARPRGTPTATVTHALDHCPDCGTALGGGSLKRTREVIDLAPVAVQVIAHQYVERVCPLCRKRWTPAVALREQVVGRQRLGLRLVSLIVTLREVGRLPVRTIQWYLATVHGLQLSVGAITTASQRVAHAAQDDVAAIREQVRASPAVHADETGWRTDGRNGYVWTFSTPQARYFTHGRRTKDVVDTVLGPEFSGVLCSDFYAAYTHYPGLKQRCWAHLLREIHDLRQVVADDPDLDDWAAAVHALFLEARDTAYRTPEQRARAAADYRARLLALAHRVSADADAPARSLGARMERFVGDLFVFVTEPDVAPTNNLAERSLRPLVTRRKISGGCRSDAGTEATMALASLFGTWQLQGHNPYTACRQLLTHA
jgi:transposase